MALTDENGGNFNVSIALTLDGATIPTTQMTVTPAAVEEFWNVSDATILGV